MTPNELAELAGYFCNPIRLTLIEVEILESQLLNYVKKYEAATKTVPFPTLPNPVVYVVPQDKWGREMRLYFHYDEDSVLPSTIVSSVTVNGRLGYDAYNKRLNSKDIIDPLIEWGFVLGNVQNIARVKSCIPSHLLADFNRGYSMP